MGFNLSSAERGQEFLLPPSVLEWLPQDHLAFFIIDAVDQMDLSGFYRSYREDGRGGMATHPKKMVALLLYAYCTGVRSSRQVERGCVTDVAFRVIMANQVSDHTSVARFRQRHQSALAGVPV